MSTGPPDPLPGFRVSGGAGGTRACLEALLAAAVQQERGAAELEAAASQVKRLEPLIEEAARWSPGTAGAARAATWSLLRGPSGLRARAAAARQAATALRATADTYGAAERAVTRVISAVGAAMGIVIGSRGPLGVIVAGGAAVAGTVVLGGALVWARIWRYTPTTAGLMLRMAGDQRLRREPGVHGFVARALGGPGLLPENLGLPHADTLEAAMPGLAASLAGLAPGMQGAHDPVTEASLMVLAGARVASIRKRPGELVVAPLLELTEPSGPGTQSPQAPVPTGYSPVPRDAADVLRQVQAIRPDPGPPGVVSVQRLDHADGHRTWVVAIPGMQETDLVGSPVPTDMRTNLELMAGVPDDMSEVAIQAMVQAGVGPDEPVVLAGHSQGGMVAMRLASDPRVQVRFAVAAVITAGSPVGGMQLPAGVPALHLEHAQDYVPALDGRPNAADPARTTVVRDLAVGPGELDRSDARSPGGAHGVDAYVRTATQLRGAEHPSLVHFDEALTEILGDGTAKATTGRYVGVRCPDLNASVILGAPGSARS